MNTVFTPKVQLVLGWLFTALSASVMIASAIAKFVQPTGFAEGFAQLGWPIHFAIPLGILELCCAALYLFPRTAVLGAILITGYMGGAVAAHLRVGDPFVVQVLLGAAFWGGLYFRNPRVRRLIPLID